MLQATLKEEGFDNDTALDNAIKKLEADLKKSRKKEDGDEVEVSPFLYIYTTAYGGAPAGGNTFVPTS